MVKTFFLQNLVVATLVISAISATAETRLFINRATEGVPTVALVPFIGDCTVDIGIVSQDLQRYGDFSVLPTSQMPSLPVSALDVNLQAWRRAGISYLILGHTEKLSADGDNYHCQVSWEIIDIALGGYARRGRFDHDGLNRMLAHVVADAIHTEITGNRSVHAAHMIYVHVKPATDENPQTWNLVRAYSDAIPVEILVTSEQPILSPAWSPTGTKVAYTTYNNQRHEIRVLDLTTKEIMVLGQWQQPTSAPAWSASGRHLAFALTLDKDSDIYVYSLADGSLVRITDHFAIDTEPAWSVSGRHLLFTSARSGNAQIYQYNLLTGALERLTYEGLYNARGRYVGSQRNAIVYVNRAVNAYQIVLQELDTNKITILNDQGANESPVVSLDGSIVSFTVRHDGKEYLQAISLDTGKSHIFDFGDSTIRDMSWSPAFAH